MNLLGVTLKDKALIKVQQVSPFAPDKYSLPLQIALTSFKGIGPTTSLQICRRLQLHDRLQVSQLSEQQVNALSALLSAPASSRMPSTPTAGFPSLPSSSTTAEAKADPLATLLIESDLRREVRANIAHQRTIGSYSGRRHAMGYPVHGQRTKTNARTAKRLNRVERNI